MAKRMGRALVAAMKREAGPAASPRESVLGNPQRRRVLQYLCLHPCGSIAEVAKALGLSPATVSREWVTAKSWLYRRLDVSHRSKGPRRPPLTGSRA